MDVAQRAQHQERTGGHPARKCQAAVYRLSLPPRLSLCKRQKLCRGLGTMLVHADACARCMQVYVHPKDSVECTGRCCWTAAEVGLTLMSWSSCLRVLHQLLLSVRVMLAPEADRMSPRSRTAEPSATATFATRGPSPRLARATSRWSLVSSSLQGRC